MSAPYRLKKSAASLVAALRSDPHAPFSAMIEIADRCNETCVHCYQIQGEKGELETHEWKAILDELAEMGVLFLTISGGEATLRKDFLEIATYARAKRFAVKVYTNGLTMTRELARSLADLAVQEVQISLYSPHADVHDWVTRVPGSWDKAVAGVRHLVELGVAVVVKTPLMTVNADDIDEYIALVASLGAQYAVDPHLDPREDGDRETERLRVDDETKARVLEHPLLARARPVLGASRDLDRSVCGACSGSVHVEANGELRPCSQLGVSLGRATDGIRKAWHDDPQAKLLRDLKWADLHGCRDCDLQPYCTRCFANARVEAGDALGPYTTACRGAVARYASALGSPIEIPERQVGPFAIDGTRLIALEDDVTSPDQERARAHDWIRARPADPPGDRVLPGQLVQLRRPGARKAREEAVPSRGGR